MLVDNLCALPYNCGMQNITQKLNTPQLFVCKLATKVQKVANTTRQAEIDRCKSEITKLEKYTSWKLLEHAILHTFGLPLEALDVYKNNNGKWVCDGLFFSISHSNGLCAVVVDNAPIGMDLQKYEPRKFHKKLLLRIATEKELKALVDKPANQFAEWRIFVPYSDGKKILSLWCKKEALFKKLDLPAFVTHNIDTTIAQFVETSFTHDNAYYHIAIATSHTDIKTEWVEIE